MRSTILSKLSLTSLLSLAGLLFFISPMVRAADDTQDPPSRVARISYVDGSVSMQPGGTGDWGAASLNRPVTIGDKIWTDQNSRAELQAGEASIHLGGSTALSFLNLDQNISQMRLAEGQVNFRVRALRQGDVYEVDTPNLAFTVREAGAFRINVNENGDATSITVIRGQGEIAAGGQTYTVNAGQRANATGADNNVQCQIAAAAEPDALDRWAQERDLKEDNSTSAKYVSRETVGYSDLDDYGTWKEEPNYGSVWVPNSVSVGWAPYSNGYWNWVNPWGWTWVDYSPWGFAPYHYGRWNNFGSYWGWCPGPIYARPYYGPAYVGFVGGFGFGVGFGWGGGLGWFPLGWGEPYQPWYHCGAGYRRNVNVNNTYIRNVNVINNHNYNYAYAHNPHAVTATSRNNFVNGQAIHRGNMPVNEASLRGAHVTNGANVSPTRASYFGSNNGHGRVATPSSNIQNRSVVARSAPAANAAHLPARTMNSAALTPGHFNNSPSAGSLRAAGPSQGMNANRPPSAMPQGMRSNNATSNVSRPTAPARSWNAQGNVTDSGHAPQGFGNNRPPGSAQPTQMNQGNRPPSARSNSSGGYVGNSRPAYESSPRNSGNRPPATYNGNRSYAPPSYNGNRGSSAPSAPRSYSPPRSYNPSGPRGSSAPPSYSAPRGSGGTPHGGGSSAPRGGGGGGSAPHGGGSPSSHGGGGSSTPHGSGGGGSHPHR